jgi:delta14-sterol reductase
VAYVVAHVWVLAWLGVLFVGTRLLPGRTYTGLRQPDGTVKHYRMNGLALFAAVHVGLLVATFGFGFSLAPLTRHFTALFVAANSAAVVVTAALYLRGRVRGAPRRPGVLGVIRDAWYGLELNPEFASVDLKLFLYQPSLLGLWLINLSFAYAEVESHGALTRGMIAYQAFFWMYLASHYWFERGVLSMWDVIAEKLGFMLVWGDLVLVPFFYSIGGWTLLNGRSAPPALIAVACVLNLGGLWIFREANAQKDRFKREASARIWGKTAEALGGRLLVSGWWGIGRKLNYGGEILVYLSFALATGVGSVVPYLLPLWLVALLLHRAHRDERRCRDKYGELWAEYTRRVRFRIVPFLY